MSVSRRGLLSFSVYEDEDCRTGTTGSFSSPDAGEPGAGQTGLTTHMPPPPPLPPSPFTVRVPSGSSSSLSSSSSSASPVAGLACQARPPARLSRPFTVRVPSTRSSSSAYSDVGPTGHVGLHRAPRFTPRAPAVTSAARRYAGGRPSIFRVPSTSSSSTGSSSVSRSAGVAAGQPGLTTSVTPHRSADDDDNPVTVTTPSTSGSSSTGSSSTGSFYSCLLGIPLLLGSGEPGTWPSSVPLSHGPVPGFNCSTKRNPFRPSREQKPTPVKTPQSGRYKRPHDAWESHGSLDELEGINHGAEKQPPRKRQARISAPITTSWARKASNPTVDDLEETAPLGGPKGSGDGAHQRKQLHTPAETPESRRFVDVFVEDWVTKSIEQDNVAPVMRQEEVVDGAATHQSRPGQEQLPTPADTPASRGLKDAPADDTWGCKSPLGGGVVISDRAEDSLMAETLRDLGGLSLSLAADDDDDDDSLQAVRDPPPAARQGSRPRDALGRFVRVPRQRSSRRRRRRRRRRTEVELTMYHAIRWSGMGGVVPNVSVVTREPLVQMPLPCTFGDGPGSSKSMDEEEDDGFAVGLSREVVREIKKRWEERVRKMQPGV